MGRGRATHVLAVHREFRCRRCGLCCRSGWPIAVEPEAERSIRSALDSGALTIAVAPAAAKQAADIALTRDEKAGAARLRLDAQGRCHFLDAQRNNTCLIHERLGTDCLPIACRMFPRLCALRPDDTAISLSHYCPAASRLLFHQDAGPQLDIERDPPAFPGTGIYGGLDAREHPAPLVRPGVPMSWQTYALWERHAVEWMARDDLSPEEALIVLFTTCEKLRALPEGQARSRSAVIALLKQERGMDIAQVRRQIAALTPDPTLTRRVTARLLSLDEHCGASWATELTERCRARYDRALLSGPGAAAFASDYSQWLDPTWGEWRTPLRRYLGSRLFANYYAMQGAGLRSGLLAVVCALALVRSAAALQCVSEQRTLDAPMVQRALEWADWILFHAISRKMLVRFFDSAENASLQAVLALIPS